MEFVVIHILPSRKPYFVLQGRWIPVTFVWPWFSQKCVLLEQCCDWGVGKQPAFRTRRSEHCAVSKEIVRLCYIIIQHQPISNTLSANSKATSKNRDQFCVFIIFYRNPGKSLNRLHSLSSSCKGSDIQVAFYSTWVTTISGFRVMCLWIWIQSEGQWFFLTTWPNQKKTGP